MFPPLLLVRNRGWAALALLAQHARAPLAVAALADARAVPAAVDTALAEEEEGPAALQLLAAVAGRVLPLAVCDSTFRKIGILRNRFSGTQYEQTLYT